MSLKKRLLAFAGILVLAFLLLFLLLTGSIHIGLFGSLPGEEKLSRVKHYTSTRVVSSDGQLLGMYYIENRTNESIDDIPENFIQALIATEDVRFYEHRGVDTRSLLRVLVRSILLFDRDAGGGSTISQQLAKNLYPRKDYGPLTLPVAKIREAIIARRLERVYTKEEILELYLNTVSFGENTFGIAAASMTFFSKKPSSLKIEESALLIGMLKANSSYNPRNNPKAALMRRNTVISQMEKYGYLTEAQKDSLSQLPIKLEYQKIDHIQGPAPYFREHIRHEATRVLEVINEEKGTDYNLYTDGLTVVTTLDYNMQRYAEKAVSGHLKELQDLFDKHWSQSEAPWKNDLSVADIAIRQSDRYKDLVEKGLSHDEIIDSLKSMKGEVMIYTAEGYKEAVISPLDSILHHLGILQAGMLVMDPSNGNILAWVGGADYRYFKYDHVTSRRQIGSTFKPIVYATAFEHGIDPCKYIENDSVTYEDYDDWTPANADNQYGGFYSVKGALVNSVNTVSVKVLMETGIDPVIYQAEEMGIAADLPPVPSLALGSAEIPLLEMTRAYCCFENGGMRIDPTGILRIEDVQGNVIYKSQYAEPERVMSESTAEMITAILEEVTTRGTASSLRSTYGINGAVAGKTGTTQNQTDGWFIGMVPGIVAGVWVGGEIPAVRFRTISLGQGSTMALPVFARFIKDLYRDPRYRELLSSNFRISPEIQENLECPDYKEDIGFDLFDIFRKKDEMDKPPEKKVRTSKEEKDETRVGKFLRKIFGGKKDDRK